MLTLGLTECVLPVTGVLGHYGTEKATLDTEAVPPTGQVSGNLVSLPVPRPLDAPSQEKHPHASMSLQHNEIGENTQDSEWWHCTSQSPK